MHNKHNNWRVTTSVDSPSRSPAGVLLEMASRRSSYLAAKAAGQLGERPDGMVGVVPGAPASAQALAQQVNAQRLARYQEIAKGNGTALDKVQAVAGQQLIERTPAGQFVMTAAGQWQRK